MNAASQVLHSDIPFRIRIGVTGHGVLPDDQEFSQTIREAIKTQIFNLHDEDSRRRICASPYAPIAFTVLSSLADAIEGQAWR